MKQRYVSVLLAVVVFSAVAAGDTLVLSNGQQVRGKVFPLSDRYLVYFDGGGKAMFLKAIVARHILDEGSAPAEVDSGAQTDDPNALVAPAAKLKLKRSAVEFKQEGKITAVAISPDGQRVATGGADGTVTVWGSMTARSALTLTSKFSKGSVAAIQFVDKPSGSCVVAAIGHDLVVWDALGGKQIRWFGGHSRAIEAFTYRAADNTIVSVCREELLVRNFDTGRNIVKRKLALPGGAGVAKADVAPDGVYVYTAHRDFRCRRWKSTAKMIEPEVTGDQLPTGRKPPTAISARGAWVVAASGRAVIAQQRDARRSLALTGHTSTVRNLATCAKLPHRLLSADQDGTIRLWAVDSERELAKAATAPGLSSMVLSDKGDSFIVGYSSGLAHLWTIEQ